MKPKAECGRCFAAQDALAEAHGPVGRFVQKGDLAFGETALGAYDVNCGAGKADRVDSEHGHAGLHFPGQNVVLKSAGFADDA